MYHVSYVFKFLDTYNAIAILTAQVATLAAIEAWSSGIACRDPGAWKNLDVLRSCWKAGPPLSKWRQVTFQIHSWEFHLGFEQGEPIAQLMILFNLWN